MNLSIIIVNFNTKKLLLRCLNSIFTSKPKIKYEMIVVDNGSTDGSVAALYKIKNQSRRCRTKIKIIRNKENLGFAKANNQGIKRAKAEFILLLNSDTEVKKAAIDKLYYFAKETTDAGVVGPRLLHPDKKVQASVYRLPTISRAIRQYWLGKKSLLDKYAPRLDRPEEVEAIVGAAFLITPEARKRVGLLDERYFMYFEDLDYCRRVKELGLKVYYLPTAKVIHQHGASAGKMKFLVSSSKIYHGVLKHYLFNFILWSGQKICMRKRKN